MIAKYGDYIREGLWRIKLKDLPASKSIIIKYLRVSVLTIRSFIEDQCPLRASALTFYSLLSIVPVAAMIFGIAKGFQLEKMMKEKLLGAFQGHEEVLNKVFDFSDNMLENTRGGMVAGIGVIILLWTVIKLLGNIEKSFNDIWGVKESRSIIRKLGDYLLVTGICPVLALASSGANVFLATEISKSISFAGPLADLLLRSTPWLVCWILFSFLFLFMPNTKVKFKSGVIAGFIAGSLFQLLQYVYIIFQAKVTSYGAIYGSFAALPLFLIWLQLSWYVALLGAEISFACQNVDTYEFEPDSLQISAKLKRLLSLQVMHFIIDVFEKGAPPPDDDAITTKLEIPVRLLRLIIFDLSEAGLIAEGVQERSPVYYPARPLDQLSISNIIDALEKHGSDNIPVVENDAYRELEERLALFRSEFEKSPSNILLKEI